MHRDRDDSKGQEYSLCTPIYTHVVSLLFQIRFCKDGHTLRLFTDGQRHCLFVTWRHF